MAQAGKFSVDLARLVAKAKGNAAAVVKKTFLDLGTAIVQRTPVGDPDTWKTPAPPGYAGGRARGSWMYGFNAPNATDPGTVDGQGGPAQASEASVQGQAAVTRLEVGVTGAEAFGVHYITSTVPYMRRLEYEQWSKQAPEGMVRITVLEFKDFVEQNVGELKK